MRQGMMAVRLERANGEFVSFADIAPFTILPDVLLWGDRYFLYDQRFVDVHGAPGSKHARVPVYREGVAAWVIDPTPRVVP